MQPLAWRRATRLVLHRNDDQVDGARVAARLGDVRQRGKLPKREAAARRDVDRLVRLERRAHRLERARLVRLLRARLPVAQQAEQHAPKRLDPLVGAVSSHRVDDTGQPSKRDDLAVATALAERRQPLKHAQRDGRVRLSMLLQPLNRLGRPRRRDAKRRWLPLSTAQPRVVRRRPASAAAHPSASAHPAAHSAGGRASSLAMHAPSRARVERHCPPPACERTRTRQPARAWPSRRSHRGAGGGLSPRIRLRLWPFIRSFRRGVGLILHAQLLAPSSSPHAHLFRGGAAGREGGGAGSATARSGGSADAVRPPVGRCESPATALRALRRRRGRLLGRIVPPAEEAVADCFLDTASPRIPPRRPPSGLRALPTPPRRPPPRCPPPPDAAPRRRLRRRRPWLASRLPPWRRRPSYLRAALRPSRPPAVAPPSRPLP